MRGAKREARDFKRRQAVEALRVGGWSFSSRCSFRICVLRRMRRGEASKGVSGAGGYFMGYYTIWLAPVKKNFVPFWELGGKTHGEDSIDKGGENRNSLKQTIQLRTLLYNFPLKEKRTLRVLTIRSSIIST